MHNACQVGLYKACCQIQSEVFQLSCARKATGNLEVWVENLGRMPRNATVALRIHPKLTWGQFWVNFKSISGQLTQNWPQGQSGEFTRSTTCRPDHPSAAFSFKHHQRWARFPQNQPELLNWGLHTRCQCEPLNRAIIQQNPCSNWPFFQNALCSKAAHLNTIVAPQVSNHGTYISSWPLVVVYFTTTFTPHPPPQISTISTLSEILGKLWSATRVISAAPEPGSVSIKSRLSEKLQGNPSRTYTPGPGPLRTPSLRPDVDPILTWFGPDSDPKSPFFGQNRVKMRSKGANLW